MNYAFKFQFHLPECPWFSTLMLKMFSWPSKIKLVSFESCFTLLVTILMGDCLWPPQLGKSFFHSEGPEWHKWKTHFSSRCIYSTVWKTVNKDFALEMTMQKLEVLTFTCVMTGKLALVAPLTWNRKNNLMQLDHYWKVFRSVTRSQGSERS